MNFNVFKNHTVDMSRLLLVVTLFAISCSQPPQGPFDKKTPFEKGNGTQTATYQQTIEYYQQMADISPYVQVQKYGTTDVGKPLHLVVVSEDDFSPEAVRRNEKALLLINNGIHPGEPCRIDASMMLARDILQEQRSLLEKVTILIIPVYNVGGALNRGSHSRANQNGPEEYGFRGNARNLDLNRDFIKCDSRNAQTFTRLFRHWDPDIFIDTHTSNGADYQHTMTAIPTQKDKLHHTMASYLAQIYFPSMRDSMSTAGYELAPYVHTYKSVPDSGIKAFLETPRYSTGYASLFNTIGVVTEAHMLKPYKERVNSTYSFLRNTAEFMSQKTSSLTKMRSHSLEKLKSKRRYSVNWKLDTTTSINIPFQGYEAEYITSEVTGQSRISYNRDSPYTKEIPFYHKYNSTTQMELPPVYIIPQAWRQVINRLKWNDIQMKPLPRDTTVEVEVYYIEDYSTIDRPYEGHYLHHSTTVRKDTQTLTFYKGDYLIPTNQTANKFLANVLEPEATDSYFNWNFFDEILQQKEYFSSYVFDEKAKKILEQDSTLKAQFEAKREADPSFAQNHRAQLNYIYKRSKYYEKSHKRYPVARLLP
jgi:hypothetical protein